MSPPICPPFVRDLQIMFGTLHFLGGVHKLLEITNLVGLYCILHFIVSHTWWWRGVSTPKYHREEECGTETTTQKGEVIYLSAFPHLLGVVVGGEHGGHDVHHEVVSVLLLPDPLHEARLGQRHQLALLHTAAAAVTPRRKLDTTLSSYRVSQNIGPTFIYSTALEICYMNFEN